MTSTRVDGNVVLRLRGELDLHTVAQLRLSLAEALESGAGAVVVDLGDVTFIDSTGLAALLNALRRLTRAGRRLVLACEDGPVLRVLRLTRLDSTFAINASADEALRAVRDAPPTGAVA